MLLRALTLAIAASFSTTGWTETIASAAPDGASLYFISPADGATVATTFKVQFGLSGMGVAPAGVDMADTGHHHLLIDSPAGIDFSQPLPATEQVIHFGKGQTETSVTLSPGTHTLQLVLGNYAHVPFNPPLMSEEITVTVK